MSKRRGKNKLGWFGNMLLVINFLAAILLLISYITPWIDPKVFWPMALFGVAYLHLLIANILFVLIWLFKHPRFSLISLIAILLGWNTLNSHFGLNDKAELQRDLQVNTNSIRALTYNVHLFRTTDEETEDLSTKEAALQLMAEIEADVICLQEYYTRHKGKNDIAAKMKDELGMEHQFVYSVAENDQEAYGMAIFSKYPILDSGHLPDFQRGVNSIIYVDIEKEGQKFRVYNVHLRSYGFQKEDFDFIKSPAGTIEKNMSSTKRLGARLKRAFTIRSQQARSLRKHSENNEMPYMIMGDFNDTPLSFAVNHVGKGMNNSFRKKGRGWGETYRGNFSNVQIDYIMASNEFKVAQHQIVKKQLSDHFAVWADLTLD